MENFNGWHWTIIILITVGLWNEANKHGELKEPEKYDFYKRAVYTAINLFILYMAGLFN